MVMIFQKIIVGELFMHILTMMTSSVDVKNLSKDLVFKIFKRAIKDAKNNVIKDKIICFICQLCYYVDNAEYWNEFFEHISSKYHYYTLYVLKFLFTYI